jgi:uncharacterized protein YndB with AHSA1/START domain
MVKREIILDADRERVWAALTETALLEDWLAEEAEIDPDAGGGVCVRVDGEERQGTVLESEPERRLAFTWRRPGEGQSLVQFDLAPAFGGGTRLVVTERSLGGPVAIAEAGWEARLCRLELVLGRVLVFA